MTTNELTLIKESGSGKMFNTGDDVIQVLQLVSLQGCRSNRGDAAQPLRPADGGQALSLRGVWPLGR